MTNDDPNDGRSRCSAGSAIEQPSLEALELLATNEWCAAPATISSIARDTLAEIKNLRSEIERLRTEPQTAWQTMDTAPKDGTPILMTGVTAGGSRWYMDGEVYAKGWIGGSAVDRVPNYWRSLTSLSLSRPHLCTTCNGRGTIGGFVNATSGYQDDPCPDCSLLSSQEGQ